MRIFRIACLSFLSVAAGLILLSPAEAEDFCVDTVAELQAALDTAESNFEDDFIQVVNNSYLSSDSSHGRFYYESSRPHDLTIEGGWILLGGVCSRLVPPSPAGTIIDGNDSVQGLYISTPSVTSPISITVKYLTFEDGYYNGTGGNGAGLHIWGGEETAVKVESNIFLFNETSGYGGGLNVGTGGYLGVINNLFAYNEASSAYGAASLTGNASGILVTPGVEIYNNTVVANLHSGFGDGGLRIGGLTTNCAVDNNIFWGNEGADLEVDNSHCNLATNDIEDMTGTPNSEVGTFSISPGFAAPFDYHLGPNSPLLNQGIVRPVNYSMPTHDLDGLPRFSSDSPVDIGAYEFQYIFYDDFEDSTTDAWSNVIP
jgi:hypothetical protein